MASPVFSPAVPANLLAAQSLVKNQNVAVYLDASTKIEAQVTARVTTSGAVTAATFTKHEGYAVYGTTTLTVAPSAGATAISVASILGIAVGQKIGVNNELRTVSAISGNTLTIDALQGAQLNGATVYLIETLPTYPGTNSLGGTASTTYAKTTYLATGQWLIALSNTDGTNNVAVELSVAYVTAFA